MSSMVSLTVTSEVQAFQSIRRFPVDITILELKSKIELLMGVPATGMELELRDGETNQLIASLLTDALTLAEAKVADGNIIHVLDNTGASGRIFGTGEESSVQKFEISDEAYEQRKDSVRAWKQREKLGRFDPEAQKAKEEAERKQVEESAGIIKDFKVGDRCEVSLPGQPDKRGEIKFLGTVNFKPGSWVGVRYDEPLGKNDGSVKGTRYFKCEPNYGGFVKPQDLKVGDFPELSIEDMDEF